MALVLLLIGCKSGARFTSQSQIKANAINFRCSIKIISIMTVIGFTKPSPPVCLEALGMQNQKIPDSAISASSEWNSAYKAINGRLHFLYRSGRYGAWSARTNDIYQYLQVNFGDWTKVSRVAIQGRSDYDQWVTSFTISYGQYDAAFFKTYKEEGIKKVSSICNTQQFSQLPNYMAYIRVGI